MTVISKFALAGAMLGAAAMLAASAQAQDFDFKGKQIKLDQTFTNTFVQKANAKYK